MAKRAAAPKEVRYVRHTSRPEWGVGVLVEEAEGRATYLFADGQKRAFRSDLASSLIQPAEAPGDADRARLARGLATGGVATPKAVHLELEGRILESPDDPDAWLVYADWLQQQGDPRGQLITTQAELARDPSRVKLRTAEKKLLEEQGEYLLPRSLHAMLRLPRQRPDDPRARCDVTWRYGFIHRVRLAKRPRQTGDFPTTIGDLCRHPSARFLRGLTIGDLGTTGRYSFVPIVDAIAKAAHSTLEDVFVGDFVGTSSGRTSPRRLQVTSRRSCHRRRTSGSSQCARGRRASTRRSSTRT